MSCREILNIALKQQKDFDAPILIYPKCHPKAHCLVHVDGKKRVIYLSCSKCERLLTLIYPKR